MQLGWAAFDEIIATTGFRPDHALLAELRLDLDPDGEANAEAFVAGVHRISDYSSITSAEMMRGETVVNCDSKTDPRTAAAS